MSLFQHRSSFISLLRVRGYDMAEEKRPPVFVRGAAGSPEDWARTLRATELPSLTEDEKRLVSVFKFDPRDYARGKLLGQFAQRKWIEKGERLSDRIREVLQPLLESPETQYHLKAVLAEVPKSRWTVRFTSAEGRTYDVHLEDDLVEDVLNFSAIEDYEKLRRKLLAGLGEEKYVVPR